jgi:hypothetical protein
MRGWLKEQPDRTLAESGEPLHGCGVGMSRISQIPKQTDLGRKESLHPAERNTEANRERREAFPCRPRHDPLGKAGVSRRKRCDNADVQDMGEHRAASPSPVPPQNA